MKQSFLRNRVLRFAFLTASVAGPVLAQGADPINTSLTKANTSVLLYTIPLTIMGAAWLGYKYLFNVDVRDHGDWMRVLIGGSVLVGCNAAAAYFFH